MQLVDQTRPEAFVFETAAEFLAPRHTAYRYKLISAANEMGFMVADILILDARTYGVPQSRQRSYFIGIRQDRAPHLRHPLLVQPIARTVGEVVADVAFPFRGECRDLGDADRNSSEQLKYEQWASTWLGEFGTKEWVPDTLSISRNFTGTADRWLRDFGILLGTDEVVTPHLALSKFRSLPLTIPVLKRLQGIPDRWEFKGTYEEQVAQICGTTPPVVLRMIGHTIHEALSGEIIDLDKAARLKIRNLRWKPTKNLRDQDWRSKLQKDEASRISNPEDDLDRNPTSGRFLQINERMGKNRLKAESGT